MRIALLSDIHGNLIALDGVLADLAQVGTVDKIWLLGDFAAFGTRPAECVQRVMDLQAQHGKDVCQLIGGNADRYIIQGIRANLPPAKDEEAFAKRAQAFQERDTVLNWSLEQFTYAQYTFLAESLGRELSLDVAGYGCVIGFHAIPGDDQRNSLLPDSPDEEAADALLDREGVLALCGHTHLRMMRQVGGWQVVNAGSVGMSFSQVGRAEWALLTIEDGVLSVDMRDVLFDVNAVIADADAVGFPLPAMIRERFSV